MATIAIMIGAAIVNAVAFVGANALYDKYGRTDGSSEKLRHDMAVEQLQKANDEWNQKRLETLDYINQKIRDKSDARITFDDVGKALDFYNETHPDGVLLMPKKPALEDFYIPSSEHKYYEIVVVTALGGVVGYLAYRIRFSNSKK